MIPPTRARGPREFLASLEQFGIKLGLSTIASLCRELGHPERACPAILIGGTNGKGSTAAFVDEALRAAGYRSGRYTSPHLIRLEERVHIDGRPVSPADLDASLDDVRTAAEHLRDRGDLAGYPTYFEVTTAAAFLLFARAGLDVAVLEVGLGGRFDATNVAAPMATAITSIAHDHERHLGSTLGAIAAEKAGIVRPGVPMVIGDLPPEAKTVIAATCRERRAPLIEALSGVSRNVSVRDGVTTVHLRTPLAEYPGVRLALRGDHQVANAIVAVRLLEQVRLPATEPQSDLDRTPSVLPSAIAAGLERASWPGRLDLRQLKDGRAVLVDGAHTPAGAGALATYLRREHSGWLPLVLGAMADKDLRGMIAALAPVSRPLIVTTAPGARAADAAALREAARAVGTDALPEPVLEHALARGWSHGRVIAVAGSLYLAGAVLELIENDRF